MCTLSGDEMKNKFAVSILLLTSSAAICAPVNMKPGLWQFSGAGNTQTICYAESDLASLPAMLEAASKKGGTSCKWSNLKGIGNVWTYTQSCSYGGGPEQTSQVKNTFAGDTAEMVITGNGFSMTSKGKWVGACK